jgi:hypothetical protein
MTYKRIREGLPLLPTPAHLLTALTLDRILAARKGQDADDDGAEGVA